MLSIEAVNHVGIRIRDKSVSVPFYQLLGFEFKSDVGFEKGHPIILRHPSGVVLNLLGPANTEEGSNILMDVDEKYPGITHFALTVSSLEEAKVYLAENDIPLTGSCIFCNMSAVFIRDTDRNVIVQVAYRYAENTGSGEYAHHP
jgi:lactoylglutathione lyase